MAEELALQLAVTRPSSLPLRLVRHCFGLAGLLIVGLITVTALGAPVWAPHPPDHQFPAGLDDFGMPRPPSREFLLGTDSLGRDVLSRIIYGARISLLVGTVAMLTAVCLGTLVGLVSGYFGRRLDFLLMRLTDIMMTFPALLLAIALVAVLKPSIYNIFLVIGIVSWTDIARVVRSEVLSLKEREFVEAARALGSSHGHIIRCHILPNVTPTIIVLGTMRTAGTILLDAGLSFLGIGVPPPAPSWGQMISDGQAYYLSAPWILTAPAICVVVTVIGFNLLGRALQDVLDPYAQKSAA